MNKTLIAIIILWLPIIGKSQQSIQASIRMNNDSTKTDILFKPNYTSKAGEYCFFLQFAVAIPAKISEGFTAIAQGVNVFSNMGTFTPIAPYTETFGTASTDDDERVFGWVFAQPAVVNQSWKTGEEFTGIVVTFNKNIIGAGVKMLNLANTGSGGGMNTNTYFTLSTGGPPGSGDRTNYTDVFYSIPGVNQLGTYPNTGDQYVQIPVSGKK